MNKSASSSATAPRLCPTCGTRVGAAATKCLVCGADLTLPPQTAKPQPKLNDINAPQLRVPVPLIIVVILVIGIAVAGYYYLNRGQAPTVVTLQSPTSSPTQSQTA